MFCERTSSWREFVVSKLSSIETDDHDVAEQQRVKDPKKGKKVALSPLDLVRSNGDIRGTMYSYLTVQERGRLGRVDQAFYRDAVLGQRCGVYGSDGISTVEALRQVKEWIEFQGTPLNFIVRLKPKKWHLNWSCWLSDTYDCHGLRERVVLEHLVPHFDAVEGYDLKGIWKSSYWSGYQKIILLMNLKGTNQMRKKNKEKLAKLEQLVQSGEDNLPYNALFRWLEECDIERQRFLWARYPPSLFFMLCAGYPDYSPGKNETFDYTIQMVRSKRNDPNKVEFYYMGHLRPGMVFTFKDANGVNHGFKRTQEMLPCQDIMERQSPRFTHLVRGLEHDAIARGQF